MGVIFLDSFTSVISASWTKTDTEGKTSVVAQRALFNGGKASPAWDDPRLTYGPLTRSSLGAFTALLRLTNNSDDGPRVSLSPSSSNSSAAGSSHVTYDYPDHLGAWTANRLRGRAIDYLYVVVPRPSGGFWRFISGGEFGNFPTATLVGISDTETDATLYAHIANRNSVFYVDNAAVLDTGSLPAALATRYGPSLGADDFGSGSSLSGRNTPFGTKAWTVVSGTAGISGGNATLSSGSCAQFNAGAVPRVIEGYLTRSDSGSRAMLYFRGNNTDAGSWRVKAEFDRVSVHNASGLVDQTGAIAFTEDVAYHVRVVDYLTYLEVFVNGTRYLQITNSTGNTNTRVGVGCENGTGLCAEVACYPATVTLNSDFGPYTAVPQGQAGALFSNTFTGSNGVALSTHDSAWTAHTGTWVINTNRIRMSTAGVNGIASRSTGSAGVAHEIKADILLPSTTPVYPIDWFPAVFARYTDVDNFIMARFLYQDTSNEVELWQHVGGTGTLIGYTNLGVSQLAPSSTHNLALAVSGAEAAAYMDGLLVVQATTTVLTGSRAGIGVDDNLPNGQPSWDNVEIRAAVLIAGPVISGTAVTGIGTTTATVTCTTDVPSTVRVNYGTTTAYGSATAFTALGTTHVMPLSGLTANTLYHYQVEAQSP
jgi:hypothetical protein